MSRKWALVGSLALVLLMLVQPQVAAIRTEVSPEWDCGLHVHMLIEDHDMWATGATSDIYVVLTLLDVGSVIEFLNLLVTICVTTEIVHLGQMSIPSPWDEPGDRLHIVGHFNITADEVNNAGWDIYYGEFYVQLNYTVRLQGGEVWELYTHPYGPYLINISTFSFVVLWPFPPIILMMTIYWVGLFGLRKFNRRYLGMVKPKY